MVNAHPLVSFVTCTYNSERLIKDCLDSVKKLDYPKNRIEVVIIDGFSKDKTVEIAKKYSFVKVFRIKTNGPEIATALGYQRAKGKYVVNFPSDNIIIDKKWLTMMVEPLEKHPEVIASETHHYAYVRRDSMMNRYYSLLGVNDLLPFYFNKRDRATHYETGWHLPSPAKDCGNYFIASFTADNLPTVGANGFILRNKFAKMISRKPERFFHMDTCLDLVKKGYDTFAFVKTDIWHRTAEDVLSFFRKRKRYVIILYLKKLSVRRYHIFNVKKDKLKLILFVLLSVTFIEPFLRACRGFITKRDFAWFLHPFVCFLSVVSYVYTWLVFVFYEKQLQK